MAIQVDLIEPLENPGLELVAKLVQAPVLLEHLITGDFARLAEADDAGDVERARAHPALMPAAVHLGREPHARSLGTHVDRANSLGAVNLVPAQRHQVIPSFSTSTGILPT